MTITYAKVGGPPDNWIQCRVFDDRGNYIEQVLEVNTEEGWLEKISIDDRGNPRIDRVNETLMTERLTGNFEIRMAK